MVTFGEATTPTNAFGPNPAHHSTGNRWLRQERNVQPLPDLWQALARKMRGHFNYFGVTDNSRALYRFEHAVHRLLFKGLVMFQMS